MRVRLTSVAAVSLVVALLSFITNAVEGRDKSANQVVTSEIVRLLNSGVSFAPDAERFRPALRVYYKDRAGTLLWLGADRMTTLINRLTRAEEDGLDPSQYPITTLEARRSSVATADTSSVAETELFFSAVFLAYASDLKVGRLSPRKLDPELFAQTKTIDGVAVLAKLSDYKDLNVFFRLWAPHNPEYRALRVLLSVHREIAASGGWPTVPPGETLKPGMRNSRISRMRARLRASGDITVDSAKPDVYDPALVMAVKRFQKRHGLEPDGVVGKQTVAAMNIAVEERIRQIVLNMERWRWLPEDLGDSYILVNIAGFKLHLVDAGAVWDRMRVAVGKPYRRTPVFSDRIRYLEFNPYWTVPYSIATRDLLPKIKENPGILKVKGYELLRDGKSVAPETINWSSLSRNNFPNQFAVYLHDTPGRQVFGHASRAFSSGCIRLARPIDLAEEVLRDTPDWNRERIDAVLETGKRTVVNLKKPLPVHLTYSTAWSGEGGTINFRPDIYGRDKSLHEALFPQKAALRQPTTTAARP
jgi:murein L,D-transpeptidase YcbB/YkuD